MIIKRKFLLINIFILLFLLHFSLINVKSGDEKEKKDNEFAILIGPYGLLGRIYKNGHLEYRTIEYYEEEQPITLLVLIAGNPFKTVNIGQNDWYNMIKYYVKPKGGEEREINFKVISGEDLVDGKLTPNEKKEAVIEILDKENKLFESDHFYQLHAKIMLNNGVLSEGFCSFEVTKAVTSAQRIDLVFRKGEKAFKEEDYLLAAVYYLDFLKEIKKDHLKLEILNKIYDAYEKGKDYKNAKKYLLELIKYDDDEVNMQKKQYEKWVEKKSKLLKRDGKFLTFEEYVDSVELEIEGKYLDHLDIRSELTRAAIRRKKRIKKLKELDELIDKEEK